MASSNKKSVDHITLDDGSKITLVPDREKIGGAEKLQTMGCDEIDGLLAEAMTILQCRGQFLMANVLYDFVWPILMERERAEYRYVLASEYPDAEGPTYFGSVSQLSDPENVDLSEIAKDPFGNDGVAMKRIRIS
jgi:hypothetical protein